MSLNLNCQLESIGGMYTKKHEPIEIVSADFWQKMKNLAFFLRNNLDE